MNELQGLSLEEQNRQKAEWSAELAKVHLIMPFHPVKNIEQLELWNITWEKFQLFMKYVIFILICKDSSTLKHIQDPFCQNNYSFAKVDGKWSIENCESRLWKDISLNSKSKNLIYQIINDYNFRKI